MNPFRRLTRTLLAPFRRRRREAEMKEEMGFHLAMRAETAAADGADPAEATHSALRKFGNVARIEEEARAERAGASLEHVGRDLALAVRSLRKSPGYTLTCIVTLALGIGASTAVFSVVRALLLAPLAYHNPDQLIEILSEHREQGYSGVAPATFGDVAASGAFAATAAQYYYYLNLTGVEPAARVVSADVTPDFFQVFAEKPLRGRLLEPADFKPTASPVAVLAHKLWSAQFNADEGVIGRQIVLDDISYTVVGVLPESFKDPGETAQLWRPMRPGTDDLQNRSARYWNAYGRLGPAGLTAANTRLETLARRLRHDFPQSYEGWNLRAARLSDFLVSDYRTGLLVVSGAIGCVVLITCANLTGLAIVRAVARRKELAIRTALGSTRGQLVQMLVLESVLVSLAGGLAGVLLASSLLAGVRVSLLDSWLPRTDEIALNLPVLLTCLAVTVTTGILAGLVPGLAAARVDAGDAMKDCARGSTGPHARWVRTGLIVVELALAFVLVVSTGLLGRSFLGLVRRDSGLQTARVLSLTVSLSGQKYNTPEKSRDYYSRAEAEVVALPGVEAVGFTQTTPFRWGIPVGFTPTRGDGGVAEGDYPQAFYDSVNVDYFKAVGCRLLAGRRFDAHDDENAPPVVILGASTARKYFGKEDPVGRFITAGLPARFQVVGVVGDVRRSGLIADAPLQVYRPLRQRPPAFATLMIRTTDAPSTLGNAVQAALARVDSGTPVSDIATLDSLVSRSVTQPRLHLTVFGVFAGLALLLAAIGLYGLIAYSVDQRTREFGIRSALGARPRAVLLLVLREGLVLALAGVALGTAGALASTRILANLVYATSLHDPVIFVGAPIFLVIVAAAACLVPARRATRVDPIRALRSE